MLTPLKWLPEIVFSFASKRGIQCLSSKRRESFLEVLRAHSESPMSRISLQPFTMRSSALKKTTLLALLILAAVASNACRQDMHDQPKYRPLRPVEQVGTINDGRSARPAIEGTVARGELKEDEEFYTGKLAGSAQNAAKSSTGAAGQSTNQTSATPELQGFVTEFPFQITESDLDRGQQRFNIYCSVCHGPLGDGGGMIPKRGFRKPPSYHDDRLRKAPVGYFFDVIK